MITRGARVADFKQIEALYLADGFVFDAKHLERVIVIEDNDIIVAVGVLTTILECAFITNHQASRKSRVLALTHLVDQTAIEMKNIGFDIVHAFVTNEAMLKILKSKFNFIKTKAIQVLVKWND